jgi:hypothetical protein
MTAVRLVAICHDPPGAAAGRGKPARPGHTGHEQTGRRRRSPNRRRQPAAATATGCYPCPGSSFPAVPTGGRGPPAVTTGGPAGQRSPRPAPQFPPSGGGPASQPPPPRLSAPAFTAAGKGLLAPRRPCPPHGRQGSPRESQKMKSQVTRNGFGFPCLAPRYRPARPAPGAARPCAPAARAHGAPGAGARPRSSRPRPRAAGA